MKQFSVQKFFPIANGDVDICNLKSEMQYLRDFMKKFKMELIIKLGTRGR